MAEFGAQPKDGLRASATEPVNAAAVAALANADATLARVLPPGRALSALEPERYRDEVAWVQLTQLVERYEPDDVYTDSEWDWDSTWWRSREWLAWLFNDSPVRARGRSETGLPPRAWERWPPPQRACRSRGRSCRRRCSSRC